MAAAPADFRDDKGRVVSSNDKDYIRAQFRASGALPPEGEQFRRATRRLDPPEPIRSWRAEPDDFERSDAGHPLGHGMPLGSPLREDGDTHREAWMRIIRADACAYCEKPTSGTVDHIEPRCQKPRGIGGCHSWLNFAGACANCNSKKSNTPLLLFLVARRGTRIKLPVAA